MTTSAPKAAPKPPTPKTPKKVHTFPIPDDPIGQNWSSATSPFAPIPKFDKAPQLNEILNWAKYHKIKDPLPKNMMKNKTYVPPAKVLKALLNRLKGFKTNLEPETITPPSDFWDFSDLSEKMEENTPLVRHVNLNVPTGQITLTNATVDAFFEQLQSVLSSIYAQIYLQISHVQVMIHGNNGGQVVNSSTFEEVNPDVLTKVIGQLKTRALKAMNNYGDITQPSSNYKVNYVQFRYVLRGAAIVFGTERPEPLNYDDYIEISDPTTKNCLYDAIFVAMHPASQYLIGPDASRLRMQAARQFKSRLQVPKSFKDTPDLAHLTAIAEVLSIYIHVYDAQLNLMYQYGDPLLQLIRIKVDKNHASALIPKASIEDILLLGTPVITHRPIKTKSYLIRPVDKAKNTSDKIATWDIETYGDFHTYLIGLAYIRNGKMKARQWLARKPNDVPMIGFLEFLRTSRLFDGYTFYAHNGGKFDVVEMLRYVKVNPEYQILHNRCLELNNSWISIGITANGCTWWFKDSYRMLPGSLKDLTREFKVEHQKLDDSEMKALIKMDDQQAFEFIRNNRESILKYNLHDCRGLLEVIIKFQKIIYDRFQLDIVKYVTAANLAKNIFLSNFYDKNKPLHTLERDLDREIRKAYWGGRNECFTLHQVPGPIYYYDFTSLYPYTSTFRLPYGTPTHFTDWKDLPENHAYIFKGKIRTTALGKTKIPAQCYLQDSRLLFPYFNDWTDITITGAEHRYGVNNGLYEYQLTEGWYWKQAPWMSKAVQSLFDMKKQASIAGDTASKLIYKIMLNSLYGVWGFVWYDKDTIEIAPSGSMKVLDYIEKGKLIDYNDDGNYCFMRVATQTNTVCNVAIAAYITAYARIQLHAVMQDIVDAGYMVHYCDTDSIMTNLDMSKHALGVKWRVEGEKFTGENLGELKNEVPKSIKERYFEEGIIAGCKMYHLGNCNYQVNKLKGWQGKVNYDILKDVDTSEATNIQTSIVCNRSTYLKSMKLSSKEITKRFRSLYTKGLLVEEAGLIRTKPIEVPVKLE